MQAIDFILPCRFVVRGVTYTREVVKQETNTMKWLLRIHMFKDDVQYVQEGAIRDGKAFN